MMMVGSGQADEIESQLKRGRNWEKVGFQGGGSGEGRGGLGEIYRGNVWNTT